MLLSAGSVEQILRDHPDQCDVYSTEPNAPPRVKLVPTSTWEKKAPTDGKSAPMDVTPVEASQFNWEEFLGTPKASRTLS